MEMLTFKNIKKQMKKLILATAVVALFTACHSTTEADLQNADSTSTIFEKLDSITPLVDSVSVIDTTIIDTTKK
jgi:hypothetical protein